MSNTNLPKLASYTQAQQTDQICYDAVREDPANLKYAYYQNERVCLTAIYQDPDQFLNIRTRVVEATHYWPIGEMTHNVITAAVKGNPMLLKHIPALKQTLVICEAALINTQPKDYKEIFKYISNPKIAKILRKRYLISDSKITE